MPDPTTYDRDQSVTPAGVVVVRTVRIFVIGFATSLAVALIAVLILVNIDLGSQKERLTTYLSQALGRDLRVEGELALRLGSTTRITARDFMLANPEWGREEEMVRVGYVSAAIDSWSVLFGTPRVEHLELRNAIVHLEQRESGERNWVFTSAAERQRPDDGSREAPRVGPPVLIEDLIARDIEVTLANPDLKGRVRAKLDSVDHHLVDDRVRTSLAGAVNDIALELESDLGPRANLRAGEEVTVLLEGHLGEITIDAAGRIDNVFDPRKPEARVALRGPNAEYLFEVLKLPELTRGPLDVSLVFAALPGKVDVKAEGQVGEFEIALAGSTSDFREFAALDLEFAASGPDMSHVGRVLGLSTLPELPFATTGRITKEGTRANLEGIALTVGDTQMTVDGEVARFPELIGAQVQLHLRGDDIRQLRQLFGLPGLLPGPFDVRAELSDAADGRAQVTASGTVGAVTSQLTALLGQYPKFEDTQMSFKLAGPDISVVTASAGLADLPAWPFSAQGDAQYAGGSLRFVNSAIELGTTRLTIDGDVDLDHFGPKTDIKFELSGADLDGALAAFGVNGAPAQSFAAAGRLRRVESGSRIEKASFRVGEVSGKVDGRISDPPALTGTEINLELSGPNLADALPRREGYEVPSQGFAFSGRIRLADEELQVERMAFRLGSAAVRGEFTAALEPAFARGRLNLSATAENATDLLPAFPAYAPPGVPIEASAIGVWDDDRWSFETLLVKFADTHVRLAGVIAGPPDLDDTDLTIDLQGTNLAHLGTVGDFVLPELPFRVNGRLVGTPAEIAGRDISATIGDSDLELDLTYRQASVPDVTFALDSKRLDLRPFQRAPAPGDARGEPRDTDGDGRLIPDRPLPVAWLSRANAAADIEVGRLMTRTLEAANVRLLGRLRDGALRIERLHADTNRGRIDAALTLTPASNAHELQVSLRGEQLKIGRRGSRDELETRPKVDLTLELNGRGDTVRAVAASLDGKLRVQAGGGILPRDSNVLGRFWLQDFASELIATVNPLTERNPDTQLVCAVVLLDVEDGVVSGSPALVLQTAELNIFAETRVDLETEKLNMDFSTRARRGLGISIGDLVNPFTKVTGTLASPTISVDTKGALIEGGAAVATAGLSFVAKKFRDRFLTAEDPCAEALEAGAEKDRRSRAGAKE